MNRISALLVSVCLLFAGNVAAQQTQAAPMKGIQIQKITPANNPARVINPGVIAPLSPAVANIAPDAEAQVQAEIRRLQKQRDNINSTMTKVWSNFLKLNATPAIGNSCIDPNTTWNPRSGESYTCVGQTTCNARATRWSKNKFNPCESGVTIDSCVVTEECKGSSVCDVGAQRCIPR